MTRIAVVQISGEDSAAHRDRWYWSALATAAGCGAGEPGRGDVGGALCGVCGGPGRGGRPGGDVGGGVCVVRGGRSWAASTTGHDVAATTRARRRIILNLRRLYTFCGRRAELA